MLIAGDDDIAKEAVSFRYRNGEQRNGIPIADAVAEIVAAVAESVRSDGRRHCVGPAVDPASHRVHQRGRTDPPIRMPVTIALLPRPRPRRPGGVDRPPGWWHTSC